MYFSESEMSENDDVEKMVRTLTDSAWRRGQSMLQAKGPNPADDIS